MRTSKLLFASMGVGSVALLFHVVGLSTTYWLTHARGHNGLWKACFESLHRSSCYDLPTTALASKFQAARAFSIIGFMAGAAALALTIVYMFVKDLKLILILATGAAGFAAFSAVISFGAFASYYQPSVDAGMWEFSWSFGLCIVGFVFFLAHTGLLAFNAFNADKGAPPPV